MNNLLNGFGMLKQSEETNEMVVNIPLHLVYTGKQDREVFKGIEELGISIEKFGQQMPIVVRADQEGRYLIIAGERRYRAIKHIGQTSIKAIIKSEENDFKKNSMIMLIENISREDLTTYEKAKAFENRIVEHEISVEELANTIGRTSSYIRKFLAILKYGEITLSLAKENLLNSYPSLVQVNKIEKNNPQDAQFVKEQMLLGFSLSDSIDAIENKKIKDTENSTVNDLDKSKKSLKISITEDVLCCLIAKYERKEMFAYCPNNSADLMYVKNKLKDIEKKVGKNGI